jgi:hypothetical protein
MTLLRSAFIVLLVKLVLITNLKAYNHMKDDNDSTTRMVGCIFKEVVTEKGQKMVGNYDYYFQEAGSMKKVFIKTIGSKVSEQEMDKLVKRKTDSGWISDTVEIKATIATGNWDAPDLTQKKDAKPEYVPSRQGKYVTIQEISTGAHGALQQFEGRIIKLLQATKNGRKLKIYDYFFEIGKERYYIKSAKNTLDIEQLESHITKIESGHQVSGQLKIQGEINYGLWDTNDPQQQSRVGKYICIYKIME